jgi:predicted aspartyl protease
MGTFRLGCKVQHIADPARVARVEKLLVDTGSDYTWIPGKVLEKLGVEVVKKDVPFTMANGQLISRNVGFVILYADKFKTIDEVVFGMPGDMSLLGARTLEGFNAAVDSKKKKLVAAGPVLAAGNVKAG